MTMQQLIDDLVRRYPQRGLQVDGHPWTWVDTGGDGRPIVLLHGSAADALMFAKTLGSLGTRLRMISVSLPGLWQPLEIARGLDAVLRHLGIVRPLIVGSSLGAYLAPFYAHLRPDNVGGLLLGNGFVDAGDLAGHPLFERTRLEAIDAGTLHREWTERIDAAPASELQVLQRFMLARKPAMTLQAHFLAVVRADACPPLRIPPERVTVLACDDDPVIGATVRQRVGGQFAGARMISFERGGHYPHVLVSEPYEALLLEVLRDSGPA